MKRCIEAIENQLRKEVLNTEFLRSNSKKIKELSITLDSLVEYVATQEDVELQASPEESQQVQDLIQSVKEEISRAMLDQGMFQYDSSILGEEGRKFYAYKVQKDTDPKDCLDQILKSILEESSNWCEFDFAKSEFLKSSDEPSSGLVRGLIHFKGHRYSSEEISKMSSSEFALIEKDLLIQVKRGLYK